jgi:hypothetical protein
MQRAVKCTVGRPLTHYPTSGTIAHHSEHMCGSSSSRPTAQQLLAQHKASLAPGKRNVSRPPTRPARCNASSHSGCGCKRCESPHRCQHSAKLPGLCKASMQACCCVIAVLLLAAALLPGPHTPGALAQPMCMSMQVTASHHACRVLIACAAAVYIQAANSETP